MAGRAKTLNTQQQTLLLGIMSGMNHTDAARAAGYKDSPRLHSTVTSTLKLPIVAAELARMQKERASVVELTADWFRRELAYQYGRVRDADNAGDALRALELAGKHLGLLGGQGDNDLYDQAARLMQNLTTLTAVQMAAQAQSGPATVKTVDATVRETLGLPAADA